MERNRQIVAEIVDTVNSKLPVHIDKQDGEDYPEFMKMLLSLSQHITEKGIPTDTQRYIKQAEDMLRQEKGAWLHYHILYNEVKQMVTEFQMHGLDMKPSSDDERFYTALDEVLTTTEIHDYLDCNQDPNIDTTLLGLSRAGLEANNPHKKQMQSIQKRLIPLVEGRLKHKCEELLNYHDASTAGSNQLTLAKASQLPNIIESEKISLVDDQKLLKQDRQARNTHFVKYYQVLVESLHILEELITTYRLKSQEHHDVITSECLAARCDAMAAKIKTVELELLCDTYTVETVKALKTIRHHLDVSMHDTQAELQSTTHALKAYEAVGMGYDQLVQDFTILSEEIANKKWALQEFKQNMDSDSR